MANYKRLNREMPDKVKQKISIALKGRIKSQSHRENISRGLKNYWNTIPSQKPQDESGTTIEDIML